MVNGNSTIECLDDAARDLLFAGARTVNNFAPTPVSDDELAQIWEMTRWAPTAANSQPMRVQFIRTDAARRRLLNHLDEGNRGKTASAPVTAILAIDSEFHEHLPRLLPIRPQIRDVFADNNVLRERTGNFNAALQAGYFVLAIRAAGLAAGPMAGFDPTGIDAEFFSETSWRSILVVNIGHPGENPWFERLPRLDPAETVRWA
ncbi:malonic semialdehyde reductase [Rhodococcus oxybenzonivorans]|uniref:malonic semialdehyde reductase n=1 Tax=Rhodococcus oxybenzonivorans TaxID=1990687 RepID=UPI0029558ADD|nr:malonic semialdehyde reductase [Rhodococcus oxybenzonivorans]MDV7353719.1 malonic semialdehyde reductase [Rhodococcus oxybenzonivorans]